MLKKCLVITALCAASANLCHAATVEVAVDTNNTIANVVANSIIANGQGADWTGGFLRVDLTSGFVHNGSPDSNFPQSAFWAIPGFEQLEWDTWVCIPGNGTCGIAGGAGALGDLEGLPLSMSGTGVGAIYTPWFNTTTTDTGVNRIGNISLTDDAQGTWSLITSFSGGVLLQSSGVVINGVMVPEPSALALLAVGGLALTRRRRGL